MSNEQKEYQVDQEPFPYKTYDEILLEKQRRMRFHRGMVVMSGFFLMCCAVVIGISMVWSRSANPLELFSQTAQNGNANTQNFSSGELTPLPGGEENGDAVLPSEPGTSDAPAAEGESGGLILVTDVSAVVKQAQKSVVGIGAERYSGTGTIRTGSGIILTEDGYIVTTSHSISGCDSINVTLNGGENYTAFVIGDDSYSDIAVLKIDVQGLQPALLGDSDQVEVGQPAIALGSLPGQSQGTAAVGIISGVERNVLIKNAVMSLLQTDAAINRGNSGGPLLDRYGQVVGISSSKITVSGCEGMGFAIPINLVRSIAEGLIQYGSVAGRPMLGVNGSKLSSMASGFCGLSEGIYLTAVDPGSGAAAAGLQAGDVITHLNDVKVTDFSEACVQRDQFRAGEDIAVTYCRKKVSRTVWVHLMDRRDVSSDYNF